MLSPFTLTCDLESYALCCSPSLDIGLRLESMEDLGRESCVNTGCPDSGKGMEGLPFFSMQVAFVVRYGLDIPGYTIS